MLFTSSRGNLSIVESFGRSPLSTSSAASGSYIYRPTVADERLESDPLSSVIVSLIVEIFFSKSDELERDISSAFVV